MCKFLQERVYSSSEIFHLIEQNSIQVRANNGLTILSVNYEYNYLAKNENNPEIENLKNKLELIQEELTLENAHLSVVKEDIAFLQANRNIGGQNTTITAAALQQTSEFYSKSITKLKIKEINRTKYNKIFKPFFEKIFNNKLFILHLF